jgi:hypothetical protein
VTIKSKGPTAEGGDGKLTGLLLTIADCRKARSVSITTDARLCMRGLASSRKIKATVIRSRISGDEIDNPAPVKESEMRDVLSCTSPASWRDAPPSTNS